MKKNVKLKKKRQLDRGKESYSVRNDRPTKTQDKPSQNSIMEVTKKVEKKAIAG